MAEQWSAVLRRSRYRVLAPLLGTLQVCCVCRLGPVDQDIARTQLAEFDKAIAVYRVSRGVLPSKLAALTSTAAERRIMDRIPLDPWGQPYGFVVGPEAGAYTLRSSGPDRILGTHDDLVLDRRRHVRREGPVTRTSAT